MQKGGGIGIESTYSEGGILILDSDVCNCSFEVQQYFVLLDVGEHCIIEAGNAQRTSCASCIATSCFVVYSFEEPERYGKASH